MEIKNKLLKPYTNIEKMNFIIAQNQKLGYEIKETEEALEAWGRTEEEIRELKEETLNRLKMTPLDLITAIKSTGLTDEQVENFLNNNLSIKHQLLFCRDVYCGVVRQMCPIQITEDVSLTDEMIVKLFKNKYNME